MKKIIVLNIAGLSPALLRKKYMPNINKIIDKGTYRRMIPTFPALTCSVQSSLLSGKFPAYHGIVGNGYFDNITMKPEFWRQENGLVRYPRLWDIIKDRDHKNKIAILFWQNSKYINADIVITPSPIHTDKEIIEWCYSKPPGLYESLVEKLGEFKLMDYWGPFAGDRSRYTSSDWISDASIEILNKENINILLAYIPHLDYICQRIDQNSEKINDELLYVDNIVGKFLKYKEENKKDDIILFIISEYGFTSVKNVIYPNRLLREVGLLKVREIKGREYIDFELSDAFAIVDHQIAHIYCNIDKINIIQKILSSAKNMSIMPIENRIKLGINHERSGNLIALSDKDSWFAYYYWFDDNKIPFFAEKVDIHNKPGYDPCELFIENGKIPLKPELVRSSHGLPVDTIKFDTSDEQFAIMICSEKLKNISDPFDCKKFLNLLLD